VEARPKQACESGVRGRAAGRGRRSVATVAAAALWVGISAGVTPAAAEPLPGNPCVVLGFTDCSIVARDPVTSTNPFDAGWSYVTDGYYVTSTQAKWNDAIDQQVDTSLSGGDPAPGFDGLAHPGYRHLTTEGPLSIYDQTQGSRCSTRAQVGSFSTSSRWYTFQQGTRTALSFSVRLDPNSPLVTEGRPVTTTGAAGDFSQVGQFKSVDPGIQGQPMLGVDEGANGVRVVYDYNGYRYVPVPAPRGAWVRLLLDVHWSSTGSGAYRVWADTNGGARNYVPFSPKIVLPTLKSGYTAAAFSFGPYHRVSPTCNGFDGVSRNGRDYSNFEVVRHSVSDPW
jgi:hypothetical protein